jgi:hypothetical protein
MNVQVDTAVPKISKVTHQGKWVVGKNIAIDCYVTDDKRRLLSLRGTARAMNLKGGGSGGLLRNLKSAWIQPYLSDQLKAWILVVSQENIGRVNGISGPAFIPFEATLFVDVCTAYVQADNDGVLSSTQSMIAHRLLGIMSAFAKVGIVSIVDEITGYQKERKKDELQQILRMYISEEFLPWTKMFSDQFYEHIFRLKGWGSFLKYGRKMPQVIGYYTNELIYKKLPDGVLEALKDKTPKSKSGNNLVRYHQSLTQEQGVKHLLQHMSAVMALMNISDTWDEFLYIFDRNFAKHRQLRIVFD